jgi:preprotein translocase subunit SecE
MKPDREDGKTKMAQAKAAKTSAANPNVFARLGKYFKDVRAELRRVVWPTRPEVVNSSLVVVVMLVIMTVFVSIMASPPTGS